jgi:NosR/NirI family transcriptional regulator, nitrous oxide reductase regulator
VNAPSNLSGKLTVKRDQLLVILTVVSIIILFFLGVMRETNGVGRHLQIAAPTADHFEKRSIDTYATLQAEKRIGYIAIAEADGYGGPLKIAVATDLEGKIVGLSVIKQRETPSWYQKIINADFFQTIIGKKAGDPFQIGNDVDGVSGASSSSRAITEAARTASLNIAWNQLNLDIPKPASPKIQFGIPEIVLSLLIISWFINQVGRFPYKKQLRWAGLLTSLVFIGFLYNTPLTLSFVNKMLMGYWPAWQIHLYWYILIGFVLVAFFWKSKNAYCNSICPFGAAQECINALAGAKARSPSRFHGLFKWLQRSLVWGAILLALLFRNPGLSSYEIFGNLFDLSGSTYQFIVLGLVMIAAVFIKRPWCRYLCPIGSIFDFAKFNRNWIKTKWTQLKVR